MSKIKYGKIMVVRSNYSIFTSPTEAVMIMMI
jgi:hypothetical protein